MTISAPVGLSPPTAAVAQSGSTIYAEWQPPTGRTGQLMEYRLMAYDISKPNEPPVELVSSSMALNGKFCN